MLRKLSYSVSREVFIGMPDSPPTTQVDPAFDFTDLHAKGGIERIGELNPYITLACDLRCKYCYMGDFLQPAKNQEDIMAPDFLAGMVGKLSEDRQLDRMTLLGGEPTLHPDITDIVNQAANSVAELRMTTNGISLHNLKLDELQDDAFYCVSVSIDGVREDENNATRGKNTFGKIIKTLQQYREAGVPLSINYTVTDTNIDTLTEVPEFFRDLGASIINFHRASLNGAAYNNQELIVDAKRWVTARDQLFEYLQNNQGQFPGMSFRIPYIFLSPAQMTELAYQPIQEENYHSPGGHRLIVFPPTRTGEGLCYMSSDLIGEPNAHLGKIAPSGVFTWNDHPNNELIAYRRAESAPNISTDITDQDVSLGGLARVSHSFKKVIPG